MTPATSGLVNSGINTVARRIGLKPRPAIGGPPPIGSARPPAPAGAQPGMAVPAPTNVAPPGSPLPVGNGIQPFTQPMVNLQAPTPTPIPAAPAAAPPAAAPAEYSPTGLNFGPGHDFQSSVIAPPAGAPDRVAMAKDTLANFDKATADQQRQDYRDVGQQASALGRLGMGQTAQDVQEVGRKHLTDRATLETQLAASTSDQAIQDAANNRGELRTERGYQTGQAQTALDRAVQQQQLEEAIRNGTFQRGTTLAELGASGNPAYAKLASAAAGDTSGGDLTGIAELLKRYGYNSATAPKAA